MANSETCSSKRFLYRDIYLQEKSKLLVFGNARLRLGFDRGEGNWLSFTANDIAGNMIYSPPETTIDFRIDGEWMMKNYGAIFLRYETEVDKDRRDVSLHLIFRISSAYTSEFTLTCSYTIFPNESRVERSVRLVRNGTGGKASSQDLHLEGFRFSLPGVTVGETSECVVDVPGPWFPKNYVALQTPYTDLKDKIIGFHGAPDGGFGFLAVTNKQLNMVLASWMDTAGEVNYSPSLRGDGERLSFAFHDHRDYRMPENFAVTSDTHRIELVSGQLPDALSRYRKMCEQTMPLDQSTPDWVREMALLEVFPSYYPAGLKELTDRLPFYREIGFNTIYLMPHWTGGYSPIDVFEVDPKLGTSADLREMVSIAHSLGMKVLFDMVIHGFNQKSPMMGRHPEYFVHDAEGNIAQHRTWKSMSTDWASPDYRQFMVDLVLHDLKEYDNDGYRVDAASFKGPNWDPNIPYPAYLSGSAAQELMKLMLEAMRKHKPDAVLLSEVFGPVFYTVCNLVHDNQTEAPQHFLEMMDSGEATAADYKAHMANVFDLLPRGANRVYFARNHDTSWFYHFNGYTPRFMALDAIHVLCAIPEIFAGDPKNSPHPDDDPAVYGYYRKLFALRKEYPELARGDLLLREVECNNANIFTALRRLRDNIVLVVISLSGKEENICITGIEEMGQVIQMNDAITGEAIEGIGKPLTLKLRPFQVLVGRLEIKVVQTK